MSSSKETERLQVVLARLGLASRRGVVALIESGKVSVNGKVVLEKGFRVNSEADEILVEGKEIQSQDRHQKRYFMLNKPKGVMTTLQDPHAERTVADYFYGVPERLFPVGRLDRDTTGLLLMTNDGELTFALTHPKFGVKKKYFARVKGLVSDGVVDRLQKGILLEEGPTAPCKIEIVSRNPKETECFVILHEGKKRQIRRIFDRMGHKVLELSRLSYGPLSLGDLRPGHVRELTAQEVSALKKVTRPGSEGKL